MNSMWYDWKFQKNLDLELGLLVKYKMSHVPKAQSQFDVSDWSLKPNLQ